MHDAAEPGRQFHRSARHSPRCEPLRSVVCKRERDLASGFGRSGAGRQAAHPASSAAGDVPLARGSLLAGARRRHPATHARGVTIDAGDEQVLHGIDGAEEALRGFRQRRAQSAFLALHRLISAARAGDGGAEATIEFGEPPAVVLARARLWDAELMVIGKAQRGLLANYFLGGITQRMLAKAPSDVLVHPNPLPRAAIASGEAHRPIPDPLRQGSGAAWCVGRRRGSTRA